MGVGLSGFEAARDEDLRQVRELLRERLGVVRVTIASDGVTSLLGALGESLGVVVAAGTGTVCVARGPQRWAKVDGWGSLLGDDGSAFAIGRRGLNSALREFDGRGGSQALLAAAAERFGEPGEMAEAVYRSPVATRTVASFARDVAQVAAQGDAEARSILEDAGRDLAVTACAALKRAFGPGEAAVVSYSGSVFSAGPPLLDSFTEELRRRRPDADLVAPQGDSLAGAALLAERGRAHAGPRDAVERHVSLERMRGGLVVSVQAPPGSPLARPETMSAIARAAELGGAVGIRAEGPADIRAIRDAVGVPVIGLVKRDLPGSPVRITPSLDDARAVAGAGADVVAVDATLRTRPDGMTTHDFLTALAAELEPPLLADVDSLDAGVAARAAGADAVATTLAGYTGDGPTPDRPDLGLVGQLVEALDCPVLAEGRYSSPDDVRAALAAGAFAVVVGAAITDPTELTRRLAEGAASLRSHGAAH